MKVLLTGAAGTIGEEVLKELLKTKKHEVTAIDLDQESKRKVLDKYREVATIRYGSILDEEKMIHLIKHTDVIIHLANITPPYANRNQELTKETNIEGTRLIINAIKRYNPNCFFIYASSINVYGSRLDNPYIQVGDPLIPSPNDYYGKTKIEAEKQIRESNIHYTIFRITAVVDHFNLDPLLFHMPLNTKLEIISLKDTGIAFTKSLDHLNKLDQRIFNVSGGIKCRTTYADFLTNVFKFYGLNFNHVNKNAFATENDHCGYYLDSHELEEIIAFQNDTLESCLMQIKEKINPIKRYSMKMINYPITYSLTMKSLPLKARKTNNEKLTDRFFKKEGSIKE